MQMQAFAILALIITSKFDIWPNFENRTIRQNHAPDADFEY
jgi:hypothetical protein